MVCLPKIVQVCYQLNGWRGGDNTTDSLSREQPRHLVIALEVHAGESENHPGHDRCALRELESVTKPDSVDSLKSAPLHCEP